MAPNQKRRNGMGTMNVKKAAKLTGELIVDCTELNDTNPSIGRPHLYEMIDRILSDEITGEKAHRWLGWIQACVCFGGGATLKELKDINREASTTQTLKMSGLVNENKPLYIRHVDRMPAP